jgi:CubicO group peptidase (beta-lactamase class C family)
MTNPRFFAESPESVGVDSRKLEELFARAEREVADGLLPSVQIAVAREGKVAGMRTFGRVSSLGRPAPATNETLYTVFSATKAITSAAVWLLLQEGKLRLDALVADLLPGFGEGGKAEVTVLHLLLHTAGFPYAPLGHPEWADRQQRLARYRRWRCAWEPGTRFEYHPTSGMWVLSDIVAELTSQDFRAFVRERIARPLGLDDLHVGLPREANARVADIEHVGAEPTDEELRALGVPRPPQTEVNEETLQRFNWPEVREVGVPGGGGIMSAAELALFYQALLTGRAPDGAVVWRPETLRLAREVRSGDLVDPLSRVRVNRGLGVIVAGAEGRNLRGFGHTGSPLMFGHNGAGGQLAWADPGSGLSLGYVTNGMDRDFVRQGRRGVGISSRAASVGLVA